MFGYVSVNWDELTDAQKNRYQAAYCGVCRGILDQSGNVPRLALRYDMAFLSLLLSSLYEPEERSGENRCLAHPMKKRPWMENECVCYAADMNVALAYYNCLDDWQDEKKLSAKILADAFGKYLPEIEMRYPRQCGAIRDCIAKLSELEKANCGTPDEVANCFGALMAELLVYKEDLWAPTLRQMGMALGRFIYLLDAAVDYPKDQKQGKYNPYIAMGTGEDWTRWEEYLVLAMGRCVEAYERLPLVQDKALLDNILYSGVWVGYHKGKKKEETE